MTSYPAQSYQSGWYGAYSRSYEDVYSPGYNVEYDVVDLQTNIYDTQNEKLIWSGLSSTVVEGSIGSAIESVIKVIVKNLSDNKLI